MKVEKTAKRKKHKSTKKNNKTLHNLLPFVFWPTWTDRPTEKMFFDEMLKCRISPLKRIKHTYMWITNLLPWKSVFFKDFHTLHDFWTFLKKRFVYSKPEFIWFIWFCCINTYALHYLCVCVHLSPCPEAARSEPTCTDTHTLTHKSHQFYLPILPPG